MERLHYTPATVENLDFAAPWDHHRSDSDMLRALAIFLMAGAAHGALMPLPWKVTRGMGRLPIDSGFHITNTGCPSTAVARFQSRVARLTGIPLTGGGRGLSLTCQTPAPDWPTLGEDESYVLDVAAGGAQLTAPTATGVLRGFETFAQLIAAGPDGFEVPAVHIEDRPRFPWRGLMMDVSRHWIPTEVIERNLDAMAAVKLNVLHWHLSDDQGFRVESKLFPKLQQFGSDGNFYTQDQIREVVAYARDRGIRVVPEFDIPGHTTAWFVGMPELAAAPGPYSIERRFGIFAPVMNAASDSVYTFLDAFVGEMAGLFPDPCFHIGGDEVEDAVAKTLQPQFNKKVQAIVKAHGKSMVGWDEVLAPDLASDTVVQSWRGPDALAQIAAKGYRGILSYGYYLNYLLPAATHYAVDPGDADGILGGEACMWAEYVSPETVDSRIWPRMAAVAERFWSRKDVVDVSSMYQRMEAVSRWLEWSGIQHRADYLPMLERLAGGQPVESLLVLGDASEAGGHDVRAQTGKYTTLTPLNRFVDAARPESELVRRMQQAASRLNESDVRELRSRLRAWVENDAYFQAMVDGDSFLPELVPLSKNLKTAGEIGLRALQYIETKTAPPADWAAQQNRALDEMSQPVAEVILAAVRPVRALVNAAGAPVPPQRHR
jgi:hexosaminidase